MVRDADLISDDLLSLSASVADSLGWQTQCLVISICMQGLGAPENSRKSLKCYSHDIVL